MPLAQMTPLPSHLPQIAVPIDEQATFSLSQTLTASGFVNSKLAQVDVGNGLSEFMLALELASLKMSAGDETYRLFLLGSNDPAFGNGNVETIMVQDFAAASAGRLLPAVNAPSDAVPVTGRYSTRIYAPFLNMRGIYVFRYFQLYAQLGGTAPSMNVSAWIAARV